MGIVVLSLFDGMSCGAIALKELGIEVDKYFASEVKKFVINNTSKNFPSTIQIGDVTKVFYDGERLYMNCDREVIDSLSNYEGKDSWNKNEKARFKRKGLDVAANGEVYKWNFDKAIMIYEGKIDLLIGGSPCQQFSFCSFFCNPNEKYGLNGDTSKLFFEYYRLLKQVKPKYFLLENVNMRKESEDALNKFLGVKGVHLNSNYFSYQNRHRIYWTNINGGKIPTPSDRKVNFQDYKLTTLPRIENLLRLKKHDESIKIELNKEEEFVIWNNNLWAYKELKKVYPNMTRSEFVEKLHEILLESTPKESPSRDKNWNNGISGQFTYKNITNSKKCSALLTKQDSYPNSGVIEFGSYFRWLSSLELAKAQDVNYGYVNELSYNQQMDVLGNGWSISTIKYIMEPLKRKY